MARVAVSKGKSPLVRPGHRCEYSHASLNDEDTF
jgi:hypothetical protein